MELKPAVVGGSQQVSRQPAFERALAYPQDRRDLDYCEVRASHGVKGLLFRGQRVGRLREHGCGEKLRTWGELGDRMAAAPAFGLDGAPGEAFTVFKLRR
jgi:hypothetical protein